MRFIRMFTALMIVLMLCSCSRTYDAVKKTEVKADIQKTYKVDDTLKLNIDVPNANIEIFTWNSNSIKFEISKRLTGISEREKLTDSLQNYNLNIKQEATNLYVSESYKGDDKDIIKKYFDIKIYTRKKINLAYFKIKNGDVKFSDEINCSFAADFDTVNLEMNRFRGLIDVNTKYGNVAISNSLLIGNSNIIINRGNIYLNSVFDGKGSYTVKTKLGNIDLSIPHTENLSVACKGNVEENEFNNLSVPAIVNAVSEIGRIKVIKSSTF